MAGVPGSRATGARGDKHFDVTMPSGENAVSDLDAENCREQQRAERAALFRTTASCLNFGRPRHLERFVYSLLQIGLFEDQHPIIAAHHNFAVPTVETPLIIGDFRGWPDF